MTISYDAEKKRATHVESGMWVEFLRRGQFAGLDRDEYYRLAWDGKTKDFEVSFNFGEQKIDKLYPNLSAIENHEKVKELNEINFNISNIGVDPKIEQTIIPNFGQIFVELMYNIVSHSRSRRCSVYFKPYFQMSQGQWSVEG
jgi:hypothetical protein